MNIISKLIEKISGKAVWIQSFSSKELTPFAFTEDQICLEDIAHALSMQCRYSGHCRWHFSVSQHSLLVLRIYETLGGQNHLAALLHDAAEAYVVDVPSPVKHNWRLWFYRRLDKTIQNLIWKKFDCVPTAADLKLIKKADAIALATEYSQLMGKARIWGLVEEPMPITIRQYKPEQMEQAFLRKFEELTVKRAVDFLERIANSEPGKHAHEANV